MEKTVDWRTFEKQIQGLSALDFNYDDKIYHAEKDKRGWHIDRYHTTLAIERIGPVVSGGAYESCKQVIELYQFADPKLIKAYFDFERPLPGRNMLMLATFAGFTFTFGVRVTTVIDEVRKNAQGQSVQVWGYSYRTLQGHFEVGEIRFEIGKNFETGEITFDIDAYSKPDRIPNFFYRIGFKLFGRSLQKHFANSSIKRLQDVATKAAHAI